jgi:hypothetical protein
LTAAALTTGPIQTSFSSGFPILILFALSTSRSMNFCRTSFETYTREQAEHFCPWAPNADR